MAFTSADLDALDTAIARGELMVRIDDKMITYQNLKDMLLARRFIQSSISAGADSGRTVPRYQLANFADDGIA